MSATTGQSTPFRFYDNRQKYLAFVNTCNEKSAVARRAAVELAQAEPVPPAIRLFDAGMGDATVLARLMRTTHRLFPTVPMLVVAKEISLEDVRLGLEKMPDRFFEHPSTVFVITNLNYAEAPRLMPRDTQAAAALNWQRGAAHRQFLARVRRADRGAGAGARLRLADQAEPEERQSGLRAALGAGDLSRGPQVPARRRDPASRAASSRATISSWPRSPGARACRRSSRRRRCWRRWRAASCPGGRLLAIQSCGNDPGLEIMRSLWPDENPFTVDRHNCSSPR